MSVVVHYETISIDLKLVIDTKSLCEFKCYILTHIIRNAVMISLSYFSKPVFVRFCHSN